MGFVGPEKDMTKKNKIKSIHILILFVIINLIVGIIIAPDFGRSTDESYETRRAQIALEVYRGIIKSPPVENYDQLGHSQFYGTASSSLLALVEKYLIPNMNHSTKIVAIFF